MTDDRDRGPLRNWAGNVTFTPDRLHRPRTVDELQRIVASSPRVKALGTGHSFSRVADTTGALVSLADLPSDVRIDPETAEVVVGAGARWGELAPVLQAHGLAMHTLGSLPHISVGGSVATGTHGSGDRNGCLATAVRGLDVVLPSGDRVLVSRDDRDFLGSVVSLGSLGIVLAVRLATVPAYDVRQTVLDGLAWDTALARVDDVLGAAMSVSLFTTWGGQAPGGTGFEQVWVKERAGDPEVDLAWTGAVAADGPRHPVPGASAVHCTEQGGLVGPWFERVPHFRLDFTPSSGEELQTEYLVAREDLVAALRALDSVRHIIAPVLQISEIRSVAADELWLSPAYGRDSVALHFTWIADTDAVLPVVGEVERVLEPYGARPHWGKVFTTSPEQVASLYPRYADFLDLQRAVDPAGKMRNAMLDRYLPA